MQTAPGTFAGSRRAEILDVAAEQLASRGIRTPLRDIAAACGILPGSLYHHFDSKEQLLVALVDRYVEELERLSSRTRIDGSDPVAAACDLAVAVAECARRHRTALLLTFYEPPSVYGPELAALAARAPVAPTAALAMSLTAARDRGSLRKDIDPDVLAVRICRSMLDVGVDRFHQTRPSRRFPALKLRVLLEGITQDGPNDDELDASPARRTAEASVASWPQPLTGRTADVLRAATSEFGRRGYDSTTMRDIASAARVSVPSLYRLAQSKDSLLAAILEPYRTAMITSWSAVSREPCAPLARVDALLWLAIQLVCRFDQEQKVEASARQLVAPGDANLVDSFPSQLREVRGIVRSAGGFHPLPVGIDASATCLYSLLWTPREIIDQLGPDGAMQLARSTVLRGATTTSAVDPPSVGRSDRPAQR